MSTIFSQGTEYDPVKHRFDESLYDSITEGYVQTTPAQFRYGQQQERKYYCCDKMKQAISSGFVVTQDIPIIKTAAAGTTSTTSQITNTRPSYSNPTTTASSGGFMIEQPKKDYPSTTAIPIPEHSATYTQYLIRDLRSANIAFGQDLKYCPWCMTPLSNNNTSINTAEVQPNNLVSAVSAPTARYRSASASAKDREQAMKAVELSEALLG